jgi:hypothetical protein
MEAEGKRNRDEGGGMRDETRCSLPGAQASRLPPLVRSTSRYLGLVADSYGGRRDACALGT